MRNIVAIDPSLISTALVVKTPNNFKMFNYCREKDAYGKKSMNKWFKICEQHIEYKFIEYREFKDYSEGEITKLKDYEYTILYQATTSVDIIWDKESTIKRYIKTGKVWQEAFKRDLTGFGGLDTQTPCRAQKSALTKPWRPAAHANANTPPSPFLPWSTGAGGTAEGPQGRHCGGRSPRGSGGQRPTCWEPRSGGA